LFGIVVVFIVAIAIMLIIGSSFSNIALSKSSSHNKKTLSSHMPSNSGRTSTTSNRLSNLNGFNNQSSSGAPLYFAPPPSSSTSGINTTGDVTTTNKVVMINFDDGWRSQLLYAKPILDKYGFKATFFIPCAKMGTAPHWMTWQDIAQLKNDKMDIESHTMTHAHLNQLLSSPSQLTYEIGVSKQCFASQGYNTPIFGYPLNLGSNNPTIVNIVAKYYTLARSGTDPLMFLDCKGYAKSLQTDCRTYSENGKLNYANRYDIRSESFFHISSGDDFSPTEMFQQFVQRMNSQIPYNTNGKINAIPIITYHNLTNSMQDYNKMASTITVDLFAQQMKYLHDNGFRVLLLNQLAYDPSNNVFDIKNPTFSTTNAATVTHS
jgi:Polysaccharide deacetylase